MMIKPGHPYVDFSGLVRDPYITSWRSSSSTLPALIDALSQSFSTHPPLYSKPAGQPQQQPPRASAYPDHTGAGAATYASGYASNYSSGTQKPPPQPQQSQPPPQQYSAYGNGPSNYNSGGYNAGGSGAASPAPSTAYVVSVQPPSGKSRKDGLIEQVTSRLQEEMTMYYSR